MTTGDDRTPERAAKSAAAWAEELRDWPYGPFSFPLSTSERHALAELLEGQAGEIARLQQALAVRDDEDNNLRPGLGVAP